MKRFAFLALGFLLNACTGTPSTPSDDNGSNPPSPGVVVQDGIEYRGEVVALESFPVQLRGNVTITNKGSETRIVWFPDGCVALLRAYRTHAREPVWDQGSDLACTTAIVEMTLAPGESREVGTPTSSTRDIVGDRLPDRLYRITITLRPANGLVEIEGGTIEPAIPHFNRS